MMFAGHHTTSTAASWTLIELLRHPELDEAAWRDELDALYADGREVSYQALREIPELECAIKETLRLHPPLIILMRKVHAATSTTRAGRCPPGKLVAVSPAVSNRMPECFPEPDRFDPDRYVPRRARRTSSVFAWIPFGGGPPPLRGRRLRDDAAEGDLQRAAAALRVRAGAAARELPQRPLEDGRAARAAVPRALPAARGGGAAARAGGAGRAARPRAAGGLRVRVDRDLCQGHGVCAGEAPEVFQVDPKTGSSSLLREELAPELRAKVEAAVRHCPTRALSLSED